LITNSVLIFLTVYRSDTALILNFNDRVFWPIRLTARSKAWVYGRSLAGIAGSNPAGAWMSVLRVFCVWSGRGFCVGLVIRPRGSIKCGVSKCDREASIIRMPWARASLLWRLLRRKNDTFFHNFPR